MKTELRVKGFHCNSCALLVKDIAGEFPEIAFCGVDIKTGKIVLEHTEKFDVKKFKKEIENAGSYKIV